ncbi:sigma-70 family RNA polymerase sigma factor [Chitinophaga sp.]|uniref:RNA polymerase sigma factor n=1 Tax=Chitinophaga sp. TaxID=1869181 RepID=UPI002F959059
MLYTSHTDEQLVQLLYNGNEGAFNEIYNRYWKLLLFIAHKRLGNAEDAREILQNVFFNLWNKRAQLSIQSLSQYLTGMTRYAVYRHLANESRRAAVYKSHEIAESNRKMEMFDIDNKQLLEILARYAGELPEKYSIVFLHHKLLDRPLEEVAQELGVSPRTAEGYIAKVMEVMRKQLHKLSTAVWMFSGFFAGWWLVYKIF